MDRAPEQAIADFLYASGYEPETIISYLEAIAASGRKDPSTGKVVIADTVYNWAEDVRRPTLYEFEKLQQEEQRKLRSKTWRAAERIKPASKALQRAKNRGAVRVDPSKISTNVQTPLLDDTQG